MVGLGFRCSPKPVKPKTLNRKIPKPQTPTALGLLGYPRTAAAEVAQGVAARGWADLASADCAGSAEDRC